MPLQRCTSCDLITSDGNVTCPNAVTCNGVHLQNIVCIHWLRVVQEGEEPQIHAKNPVDGQPKLPCVLACKVGTKLHPEARYSPVPSAVSCPKCAAEAQAFIDSLQADI